MTKRIFASICLVATIIALCALVLILGVVYNQNTLLQQRQLKTQCDIAAQGVEMLGVDYLSQLSPEGCRITWIRSDGTVLFDSDFSSSNMENHLQREEIRQALESGSGSSSRRSATLQTRSLYYALRLSDGTVLRLSSLQQTWWSLFISTLQPVGLMLLGALLLSLGLAYVISIKLVKPLNALDLDHPAKTPAYEELSPLLDRISSQQGQLRRQEAELKQKKREFEAATKNLSEGLVLLSHHGNILSINQSASNILGISSHGVGTDLLVLNNLPQLEELITSARNGEHSERTVQIGGRDYRFSASPVRSGGGVSGIALLLFDITENITAEKMRREFSANVSHELKTPLQSISGCAELLSGGLVRPEDVPRFSGQIYSESRRLISLVEDIIGLSHLDEGAPDMLWQDTDLYLLAQNTVPSLDLAAQEAGVALHLSGEKAVIYGVPQLLSGIVFNLCDNAIKYNRPGGEVFVSVAPCGAGASLTVRDTGIGIPPGETDRIFERFYRVDKSRSKAVGGTGLGLSIVKHSARLHDAEITVESALNVGTTITILFAKRRNEP